MPQKSSIDQSLSADDRTVLDKLIADGKLSVTGLTEWLGERGYEISRSAVGRHKRKIDRVARRLKESRLITEALAAELGDAAVQGKQGRLLVDMARTATMDLLIKIQDEGEDGGIDAKEAMMVGKALAELGKALRYDQDFELKITEKAEKAARAKAAAAVDAVARDVDLGLSMDTVAAIKEKILGVRSETGEGR